MFRSRKGGQTWETLPLPAEPNSYIRRIIASGHFDTVLAYYNLLNGTAPEPAPPGVSLWDNGQTIPLAKSLGLGVLGIRSHAAGASSQHVDRPVPPVPDCSSALGIRLLPAAGQKSRGSRLAEMPRQGRVVVPT